MSKTSRNDKHYKWDHPSEWLMDRINTANNEEILGIARSLAEALDGDTIQDMFQDEMDEDGYFQEVDE